MQLISELVEDALHVVFQVVFLLKDFGFSSESRGAGLLVFKGHGGHVLGHERGGHLGGEEQEHEKPSVQPGHAQRKFATLESRRLRLQSLLSKVGGLWSYVAPGTGVSVNVGRTVALHYEDAANLLAHIFCMGEDCSLQERGSKPSKRWTGPPEYDWQITRAKGGRYAAARFQLHQFDEG